MSGPDLHGGAACYVKHDRGQADEISSTVKRPCSEEFLDAILSDLRQVLVACYLNHDLDREKALACLRRVFSECSRLADQPQLFPQHVDQRRFFSAVSYYSTKVVDAIGSLKTANKKRHNLLLITDKRNSTFSPPSMRLKPWERFIKDGAPGSGFRMDKPWGGIAQLVPHAGVKLMCKWMVAHRRDALALQKENNGIAVASVPPITQVVGADFTTTIQKGVRTVFQPFWWRNIIGPFSTKQTAPSTMPEGPAVLASLNRALATFGAHPQPGQNPWDPDGFPFSYVSTFPDDGTLKIPKSLAQ